MRYDVLRSYVEAQGTVVVRANAYLAEDTARFEDDREYRRKTQAYQNSLRRFGFKLVRTSVRRFTEPDGQVTVKANADLALAVDALLQSRTLHRIILVTGDGDFTRLVNAIQDGGVRVDAIGFRNVSRRLLEEVDSFVSGFLIPGLVPRNEGKLYGFIQHYKDDKGYGFLEYIDESAPGVFAPTQAFFHFSNIKSPDIDPAFVAGRRDVVFEFELADRGRDKPEAVNIIPV